MVSLREVLKLKKRGKVLYHVCGASLIANKESVQRQKSLWILKEKICQFFFFHFCLVEHFHSMS